MAGKRSAMKRRNGTPSINMQLSVEGERLAAAFAETEPRDIGLSRCGHLWVWVVLWDDPIRNRGGVSYTYDAALHSILMASVR